MEHGVVTEIQMLVEQAQARVIETAAGTLCTRQMFLPPDRPEPPVLKLSSIQSLVEYLSRDIDEHLGHFVHIESPEVVKVLSHLHGVDDSVRVCYAKSEWTCEQFPFDRYFSHEEVMILLQTRFAEGVDMDEVRQLIGTMQDEAVKTSRDDGVTQTVVASQGIALVSELPVPRIVSLRPFCTFPEIEPFNQRFLLRLKREGQGIPKVAFFRLDGGAWRVTAVEKLKAWLKERVDPAIPILA